MRPVIPYSSATQVSPLTVAPLPTPPPSHARRTNARLLPAHDEVGMVLRHADRACHTRFLTGSGAETWHAPPTAIPTIF
eukprot:3682785-Pleurochrysis_carterae.AAC.1